MRKKFWKILGVSTAILATLLLLFVVAFIFNPFEGSLADMRELVPRNIDYFVRKTDLSEDFSEFPQPHFWEDLGASRGWRNFRQRRSYGDLVESPGGLGDALEQLEDAARQVSDTGLLDLLDDFIGTEVIVAGQLVPPSLQTSEFCLYTRVSLSARFAWGLMQWGSVQEQMRSQGLNLTAQEDGSMVLDLPGQQLFIARYLDCVMVSNSAEILDESLALAESSLGGSEGFGGSADYRDGVQGRIREWEANTGVERANAIELYARPDQLLPMIPSLENWPDPRHPTDWNQRVLASFLNFSGWRFLTSSLIFEEDSLTVLGNVDLNRNEHTAFQSEFFKADAQERSNWLEGFLAMVPGEESCAAAALRMPAGEFLAEMHDAMEPDLKTILDEGLRKSGKYENTRDLIDKLRPSFLDRTGFVFYPTREETDLQVNEPSPAPLIAWVFWIREGAREPIRDFYEFLQQNYINLGFTSAHNLPVSELQGGDMARAYANANITGTGAVSILIYGKFFVVSNSDYLIRYMIKARANQNSLLEQPDYVKYFEPELQDRVNGFMFVNGKRMERVIDDYLSFLERSLDEPDPSWLQSTMAQYEGQVFRNKYRQYQSIQRIPESIKEQFGEDVYQAQRAAWGSARQGFMAADRESLLQAKGLCSLFSSAYVQLKLNPQAMTFTSRFLMDYR
ncbi:MAG: hypothetical protein ACYTG5_06045 [Planctomycetota bacterium]|jgi:hypothetical protein